MTSSQNAPITVGLASFGMSGLVFHGPLLAANPHFKLVKVLERSSEKSKTRYPEVEVVKNFQALIQDDSVELIVINTPNVFHFEMGQQATSLLLDLIESKNPPAHYETRVLQSNLVIQKSSLKVSVPG